MDYDALVVGAGHAGIEAGLALSRLGYRTLLVTQNLDTIGQLSCNPAVGDWPKGTWCGKSTPWAEKWDGSSTLR
jgi:tRNA uridine 5-carboxymethylaminomethyl modification enzyme